MTTNADQPNLPTALFHRSFQFYTGGHGKVWDYFGHVNRSGLYRARIYFSPDSVLDNNNPWFNSTDLITEQWQPETADLLFIAGKDWDAVPFNLPSHIPIINLVQHVRHADPNLWLYKYLNRRALRICVSRPVADAILNTGRVNGPVMVIPNGIDVSIPATRQEKSQQIFIGALKNASLGKELAQQLKSAGYQVDLLADKLPRNEYLQRLGNAMVAVLLPNLTEGFYLPGLEAMALGTPVIMYDCVGNREYAVHNKNCLLVPYEKILKSVLDFDLKMLEPLRLEGLKTAGRFTLESESKAFINILKNVRNILQMDS